MTDRTPPGQGESPATAREQTTQDPAFREAALRGMTLAYWAARGPDNPAIFAPKGDRTFRELNARANQVARAFRARGLGEGDSVAVLSGNRPEFPETTYAALRTGMRITPINWHLTGEEIAYILSDCEAGAFVAEAEFARSASEAVQAAPVCRVRLAVGGDIPGFESYEAAIKEEPTEDLEDPVLGRTMLYTSGTTGRPKGVYRADAIAAMTARLAAQRIAGQARYRPGEDVHLVTGPLYHAAPFAISLLGPLNQGAGAVLTERWDSEEILRLIERHRVTHSHMVAIHFHRLLQLPEEVRSRYDLSSLRYLVHGAAPCPVEIKQRLIEWVGPIVYEYYAATEGGGTFVTPEEWLARPGTVGKPREGVVIEVWDEEGDALPPGRIGTVFIKAPERGRFEYYKDAAKTASAYRGDYFTLGDMGYFDEDGYLFLTGRSADVIISGGVNIYPAEIDAVLLGHPAVADIAAVGVPNEEWGEEVKAVVQLRPGTSPSKELAAELIAFCRDRLANFKCPRTIDFDDELPRHETGKIYRRLVRDRYWSDRLI